MSENRYEGLNGAGDKFSKIAGRAGDTAEKIGYAGGAPSLFAEGTVESALNEASDKLKAVFGGTNSSGEFYAQTKYYKTNDICVDKNTGKAYRFKASDSSVHVAPNATGGGNYWEEVSLSILSSNLTDKFTWKDVVSFNASNKDTTSFSIPNDANEVCIKTEGKGSTVQHIFTRDLFETSLKYYPIGTYYVSASANVSVQLRMSSQIVKEVNFYVNGTQVALNEITVSIKCR